MVFFAITYKQLEVSVIKVKAHTTEEDVTNGLITVVERRANHLVDVLAKRGAGLIWLPKEVVDGKDLTNLAEFLGDVVS